MKQTEPNDNTLSLADYDAVIADLDGVVTRTADVHAAAWKATFDEFLEKRGRGEGVLRPFDSDRDYRQYVDGKPRYEGVRDFLASRDIDLPWGSPEDSAVRETVCGLGNRKDHLFREKLRTGGVAVYDASVTFLQRARDAGLRTAVASSSRNCPAVLEAADIGSLFDTRVDGNDLELEGLRGKPAPDMFLAAARRLGVEPGRAIGIEDAIAGVRALERAGFGCVIGVARNGDPQALRRAGANLVVADLGELLPEGTGPETLSSADLPSALEHLDALVPNDGRAVALFLDYDGTLTPIVNHPADAWLDAGMRNTLYSLSRQCVVAVISGRDLADVRQRVGLDDIWYAGSHGFDIAGPSGAHDQYHGGEAYLPLLEDAEQALSTELAGIEGSLVERKRFSIAVHYRQVADAQVDAVKDIVARVRGNHAGLRLTTGKKVLELQPDIDWNKGRALRWLMDTLDITPSDYFPIYIGDDTTDEDAFREVARQGAGIIVAEDPASTCANYRLASVAEVEVFFARLGERLSGGTS